MPAGRIPFYALSREELASELAAAGFEKFRAKQVFDCVYSKKIFAPKAFPALPAKLAGFLEERFDFEPAKLVGDRKAGDETKKYLFALPDGNFVECVLLKAPAEDGKTRKTLCVSTQVGCACGCRFCASAMRGFVRNLTAGEIVAQALPFVERKILTSGRAEAKFEFENIVVMGMGEPLANFDNLSAALAVFNSPEKFGFGARRITVSTCGIADRLEKLAETGFPYRLAISLHGATDEVRSQIMPINKKYPLARLVAAAKKFSEKCGRMITLEYIMIENVNDSFAQARELAKIARTLHAHVNLIPYNRVESLPWRRSDAARRAAFAKILAEKGVSHTLRREKGSEIDAACGQLALKRKLEAGAGGGACGSAEAGETAKIPPETFFNCEKPCAGQSENGEQL